MNIEYFTYGNYGWGTIFKRSIDINDVNYISHTEDAVKFKHSYTDVYDEVQCEELSLTRNFIEIRDKLISSHKKKIAELQNEIDILTADTFDIYQENISKEKAKYIDKI